MSTEAVRETAFEWTTGHALATALVGAALVVAPFVLPQYQVYVLTEVLVLALFATGFNLLYGYTGLLSFGHAMFFGGAGYGLAIVLRDTGPALGMPGTFGGAAPLVGLAVAAVVGIAFAVLLAIPVGYLSVRLEEIYFAMITLSFSMALYTLALKNVGQITNGSDGITVILGRASLFGMPLVLYDRTTYYFLVLVVFALSMYALWRVVNSPFGMVCKAIRENPERTAALGVDVKRHRWIAFVLSAVFSAIAGVLIVPLHSVVAPELVNWTTSAEPVIITVFGGPFAFAGPALGTVAFRYLRWAVTQSPLLEAHWQLVFGTLVLVVVLFFKQGVYGGVAALGDWLAGLSASYRNDGASGVAAFVRTSVGNAADSLRGGTQQRSTGGGSKEGSQ
ncbi:branched-chain amino acid ABC transporter permease [Halomicrococcus sp. NG-SE-24]|uniref:branched-chain amino acid ABC transporter permease n=1 Tax=Halomicrococcus sp. NG-SE-24 TaxID=3436928 RepID=UPI003D96CAC9